MHAIKGKNGDLEAYGGFKIPLKVIGPGRSGDPAYRYDCADYNDSSTKNLWKRMSDNGDIHFLFLPRINCIWEQP